MSSFRDALDADADDVFLDLDAFADEHTFMGQKVKAVVEEAHDSLDNGAKGDFVDATALAIKNAARSGSSRRRIIWQNSR